ncbi:arylsulfotransferase family protein [Albidovulum sp.]|uniref:arylsulfotransferase family protein n=1 Tax=Albidovulum sp. TaxID=1872424 RepID=UPI0039B8CC0A
MQGFLFRKIAVWVVLLLALVGLLGLVVFGAAVLDGERQTGRFGPAGAAALAVAEIPDTVKTLLSRDMAMAAFSPHRFVGRPAGWTFAAGPGLEGYLLLSRYDGDRARHVVQFVSLADGSVKHEWLPDADTLLADAPRDSRIAEYTNWNTRHYRAIHPVLADDGTLLIKDHQSYLYGLGACSEKLWSQYGVLLHHATESDGAGGWWIPGYAEPSPVEGVAADFADDALVHLGPKGEILWQKSLTRILLDHGMEYAMFTAGDYQKDPVHLNDIQPVLEDGPYWRRGDLFLSFRHMSMVMLYRPATDEILWKQQGPWLAQHDVDILDDTRIGVFNNNAYERGKLARVHGTNGIIVYDFATGQTSQPWDAALKKADVKTLFEGLFTVLPDGTAMVEEENSGRLLFLGQDGTVRAEYINTGADGIAYRMGWTRYMAPADGEAALAKLSNAPCGG